jgi:hypothetical protein
MLLQLDDRRNYLFYNLLFKKMQMKRKCNFFTYRVGILFGIVCFFISASTAQTEVTSGHNHTIKILINGEAWSATLKQSDATKDFIKTLPLYITLKDYAGTQKVSGLPEELSTGGSPGGSEASAGDIAYYAPWDNLVIFHEDVQYTKGLVIMGRVDDNLEALLEILKTYDAIDVRINLD